MTPLFIFIFKSFNTRCEYHFLTVKTKSEVVLMKEFKLCKIMIKNLTFQIHAHISYFSVYFYAFVYNMQYK